MNGGVLAGSYGNYSYLENQISFLDEDNHLYRHITQIHKNHQEIHVASGSPVYRKHENFNVCKINNHITIQ